MQPCLFRLFVLLGLWKSTSTNSVSVAIAAEANFIALRHDFKIEGIAKPFTKEQLRVAVPNQLIVSAINACPEYVPEKVKKEVDEFKKKSNKS